MRARRALAFALVTATVACRSAGPPIPGATAAGAAACGPSAPTLCGDRCTNLASDPDNCGGCGQACAATSACIRGLCGAEVTTVVPGTPGCEWLDLAIADGTITWTDVGHGTVESARVDGSARTTLATNEVRPGHLAVSGSRLFWATGAADLRLGRPFPRPSVSVRALTRGAGPPTDLVVEAGSSLGILGLVVSEDGKTVYDSIGTGVNAVPVEGGPSAVVSTEALARFPAALALEGATLAYPTFAGGGSVEAIALVDGTVASCGSLAPTADGGPSDGGSTCARLSDNSASILTEAVLVRKGVVYWADAATLVSAPADASRGPQKLAQVTSAVAGFVAGPSDLYVADGELIERVSFAGSAPTVITLARGQSATGSMAVDATRVIWSNADCSIAATGL